MAVSTQVYAPSEFKVYFKPETTVGTANKTTMDQLNINDIVSVSTEVIQTLDVRSGSDGRVLNTTDIFTRDYNVMTTISIPIVFDSGNLSKLLEAVTGTDYTVSDTIVVGEDWTFTSLAHGSARTDNSSTYTLCIDSPITNEARYFTGCVLQELTLTMDSGSSGGRMEGNLTFVTKYRPADGTASPSNPTVYGNTWFFLCNYTTKQVGGVDVVTNKIELIFSNPANYVGCSGSNPELIARGIPKFTITGNFGIKYDANTASLWEKRRAGTDIVVTFYTTDLFDIAADHARITGDVNPSTSDEGAFIDLPVEFATDGTDDVITFTFA